MWVWILIGLENVFRLLFCSRSFATQHSKHSLIYSTENKLFPFACSFSSLDLFVNSKFSSRERKKHEFKWFVIACMCWLASVHVYVCLCEFGLCIAILCPRYRFIHMPETVRVCQFPMPSPAQQPNCRFTSFTEYNSTDICIGNFSIFFKYDFIWVDDILHTPASECQHQHRWWHFHRIVNLNSTHFHCTEYKIITSWQLAWPLIFIFAVLIWTLGFMRFSVCIYLGMFHRIKVTLMVTSSFSHSLFFYHTH